MDCEYKAYLLKPKVFTEGFNEKPFINKLRGLEHRGSIFVDYVNESGEFEDKLLRYVGWPFTKIYTSEGVLYEKRT